MVCHQLVEDFEDIFWNHRTVLMRILSAFRTVALKTLEVEAHIIPTQLRLHYWAQRIIAR